MPFKGDADTIFSKRIAYAVSRSGQATLLTSMTTMTAFFCTSISKMMPLKAFGFWSGKINYNHTYKEILANREAKFKTSLRVGFFLDFRNFIFASFAARIKNYL